MDLHANRQKMKKFKLYFEILLIQLHSNSTFSFTLPDMISTFVENTFDGYDCLNLFIHNSYDLQRENITKRLHGSKFSILISNFVGEVINDCGFVFISKNIQILYRLEETVFDRVIRLLYVSENNTDVLVAYKQNSKIFEDKDVLVAKIQQDNVSLQKKTKHDTRFRPVKVDPKVPYFHSRYFIPKNLDYKKKNVRVSTFHCPQLGSIVHKNVFKLIFKYHEKKLTLIIGKYRLEIFSDLIDELGDGVETRIFKEIVKKLNLEPIVVVTRYGEHWGDVFPNKTSSGGILKALSTREADVGFCSLWMEANRLSVIDMSPNWEIIYLKFLIPKPKMLTTNWNNILRPWSTSLWISILAASILTSCFTSGLRNAHQRLFGMRVDSKLVSTFLTIIGVLTMTKNPQNSTGVSAIQHLFLWWSFFAMIVTTLYSGTLISHLTYPQFEPMIDSIQGLVKAGYHWGTPYEPGLNHILDLNDVWHQKFARRHRYERQFSDRKERILAGNYSVLAKCIEDYYFMEVQGIPPNILHNLRTSRVYVNKFLIGFGYRKALPYANTADYIIRTLVESGITKYWLSRIFEKEYLSTTFARVYEHKISRGDIKIRALALQNLKGCFALLIMGILLAAIIFMGELLYNWYYNMQ